MAADLGGETDAGGIEEMLPVDSAEVDPYRNDLASVDGQPAALVRTGGHGHIRGRSLAFVALPADTAANRDSVEVEIFGKRYRAQSKDMRDLAAE